MTIRTKLVKPVNGLLRPLHMQLVSGTSVDPAIKDFIPARKTIAAAEKAGLPLGEYIDVTFVQPGVTSQTIDAIFELGELPSTAETICEIGPGSGRFAEKVIEKLSPRRYEIYETARDWLPRLEQLPNAVIQSCDGHTLSGTADGSVDLVHAHKVFVYLEFHTTAGYLEEMARVARPGGGVVAFDIVTEDCLDDAIVADWVQTASFYRPVPRAWVAEFMQRRGLTLRGSEFVPLRPGKSELLVFRRD